MQTLATSPRPACYTAVRVNKSKQVRKSNVFDAMKAEISSYRKHWKAVMLNYQRAKPLVVVKGLFLYRCYKKRLTEIC